MNNEEKSIKTETRQKEEAITSTDFKYFLSLKIEDIEKKKEEITNELGSTEERMEGAKKNLKEFKRI